MKKRLLAGLGALVLTASSVGAQTLSIDHQPVACAAAERFPRIEARFAPADTVATARVLFQPENGKQWYAVAMKREGPAFYGVLPKPKKSLKAFRCYVEVTDKALGTNRTADYTTTVVASAGECKGKAMAAALGSASVLLEAPTGAAAVPSGFASTGVVAAGSGSAAAATGAAAGGGGGLSTGAVVGIVAGAGAAAAGVAVATHGGGGGLTGAWAGTANFAPDSRVCSAVFTLALDLTQKDTTLAGTLTMIATSSTGTGCPAVGNKLEWKLDGSVNGSSVEFETSTQTPLVTFSGTQTGSSMGGTIASSLVINGQSVPVAGTWSATRK